MPADPRPTYDDDFYAWTQDQASALREVESYLRQLLVHILKLGALPQTQERAHWIAEAEEFQARAVEAFKPSMRRAMDMQRVWALARRSAATNVAEMGGNPADLPHACPFEIDMLVSPEFDLRAALASLPIGRAQ